MTESTNEKSIGSKRRSPTIPTARPYPNDLSAARLTEVADGVFAYVQPDGGWCLNNAGLVVSRGQSVLVDTAATETRARNLRRAGLEVAPAPRAVINTHAHGDHTFGNFVFPEAVVIGHERTRAEVLQAGLHLTGLWPDVQWGDIRLAPPTLTYQDGMTVHVGELRVELLNVGLAHSSNDTAVWLPERGVLFTGDLVMAGVTPFCPMGSVAGSFAALERLRALDAEVVVPGHGPVCGPEVFDTVEAYLRWLREVAREGLAAGLSPLDAARKATPGPYDDLLEAERLVPNLHRAYAEEHGGLAGVPLQMADVELALGEMIEFNGGLPDCHA